MAKSNAAKIKELARHFRKLGANDPEGWARSEIEDGIPQFARFVFLKMAWESVVPDTDHSWMDRAIAEFEGSPDAPYAGAGRAIKEMLGRKCSRDDISDLVRSIQAQTIFELCAYLDGVYEPAFLEDSMPEVSLVLLNVPSDDSEPQPVISLHESVLETDPTGREMRPKKRS